MTETRRLSSGSVTRLLRRFRDLRIAVVGDVMLDEYFLGDVERASPEAPVPVVKVGTETCGLGGAANVAHVAAALGAKVDLVGMIGEDAAGDRFLDTCRQSGIGVDGMIRTGDRPTIRKLRILAQHQQVLRLDWEESSPILEEQAAAAVAHFRNSERPDAVIISDYAKGFLSAEVLRGVIETAREWDVPVLVDPKSSDFEIYKGATVLTPNLKEFEAAIGRKAGEDLEATLRQETGGLLDKARAEILVVTLGERGMAVFARGQEPSFMPSSVLDVFDVSGAGDTVVAVLALGLAASLDLSDAVAVANEAAGVAVAKSGVAVVSPGELAGRFRPRVADKVLSRAELVERVAWWRVQGREVVFTNGCFDLLHAGHISLLREAAHQGDVLVVAINSDESVRRLKGKDRPIIAADERAAILAALACVDAVVTFDEDTPLGVLTEVRPDVLAKGADYTRDQVVGRELVESYGGEVHLIRLVPERSTSGLMRRIRGLDLEADEDKD